VLPTHDRPAWLAESISSVLDGSFGDYEIVVSNSGNPEHTRALQARFHDSRIRWVNHPGFGMIENFRAVLCLARGRYVAVLHDDDRWSSDFLATLIPPLERHDHAVLAFADHYIVNQAGEIESGATEANTKRWDRAKLAEGLHQPFFGIVAAQSVPITGSVFRRAALDIEDIRLDVESFTDIWISYLLAKSGGAAYFNPRRLMYYRSHGGSHSSAGMLSSRLSEARFRRLLLEDPNMRPHRRVIARKLARAHVLAGAVFLRRGDRAQARAHLAEAVRLRPSMKALAGLAASWVAPTSLLGRL
jgi:glycosyltransferase involved in cell wall biosynthesis